MRRLLGLLIVGGCIILALSGCCGSADQADKTVDLSSIRVSEKTSASREVQNISSSSFGGRFTKMTVIRNPATGMAMKESYIYGDSLRLARKSYIGEEYSSIDRLDKTTVARGLGAMETEADFSGTARYRVVSKGDTDMGEIDMDEQYSGEYALQRNVRLQRASQYSIPHISVKKEGTLRYERGKTLTDYAITIENDGGRTLEPVLVRDLFPPGAAFVSSDQRPTFTSDGAEWSFTHISPGDVLTVNLVLDVSGFRGADLVNRVEACGGYGEDLACAANYSAIEINWLSWGAADGVSVRSEGTVGGSVPNRVRYTLKVENLGDESLVATATDRLPSGMRLIASSPTFAAYEGGVVRWNLVDIGPGETETIVYEVEALWSGRFVNQVEVEARSIGGPALRPVTARSVVDVEKFDGELPRPGWQPPAWGFGEAERAVLSIF
ncbi:MAG: exported protein of unknown function [Methanothrix sp.]|jgi:uncharacterized repeat protein (TIGR01451 family)|nr:MAG: exported protein of unknown function [Methanothrix sp.]